MPKIKAESKEELLCTRVTPIIKEAITHESQVEGLTASEWLRNIVIKELKERGALQSVYRFPDLEKSSRK